MIDSHSHIYMDRYQDDRDAVIARAAAAGLTQLLQVGCGLEESRLVVALSARVPGIYAAVGVHPHQATSVGPEVLDALAALVQAPKVLAWGEIGLDFHYDNSPRDVQREVFRRQLQGGRDCGVPVIIHTREADDDTLEILLSEYQGSERGGVMHCFGGSPELAQGAIDLGFLISFSGNITFKKAQNIRDVAKQVPLDRLLIETDCPYLTPIPYRGHRNEPAHVIEVARCLADLHGVSLEDIGRATTDNFKGIFRLETI